MLKQICVWYLKRYMSKLNTLELVINENHHTYRHRNLEKENSIKETLNKIK